MLGGRDVPEERSEEATWRGRARAEEAAPARRAGGGPRPATFLTQVLQRASLLPGWHCLGPPHPDPSPGSTTEPWRGAAEPRCHRCHRPGLGRPTLLLWDAGKKPNRCPASASPGPGRGSPCPVPKHHPGLRSPTSTVVAIPGWAACPDPSRPVHGITRVQPRVPPARPLPQRKGHRNNVPPRSRQPQQHALVN